MSDWLGAPAHTEFGSTDVDATAGFLAAVFGHTYEASKDSPMPYLSHYKAGEPSVGIRPAMDHEGGPSATPYFLTADIDKTVVDAEAAGAQIVLPKTDIKGVGQMAWMIAPGGVTIAVMQT